MSPARGSISLLQRFWIRREPSALLGPEGDGDHGWDQSLPCASFLFPGESNATADGWGPGKRDPAGHPDVSGGLLCVVLDQISII